MLFGQEFHGRKISTREEMPSPARRLDARKGCAAAPGWWDQLVLQTRGDGSSPPPPLPARLSWGNPSLAHSAHLNAKQCISQMQLLIVCN